MAQADGSVIIDTRMNNDALEKGFELLKSDCESLGIACEKAGDKIKVAFADYDVSANIQTAVAKLEQAQNKLQIATDYFNDAVYMDDDKSAESWARKRDAAYTQVENAQRRLTQVIAAEANKQAAEEEKARVKATKAAEREAAKKKKAQEKVYNEATKGARKFASRFSSILSGALIFNALSSGVRQLTSYFGTALKKNSEFAASFAQLKGAFLTAVQPIYEVVAPALIYLMNLLTKATQAIIRVISLLTGKSTSQMAENAKNLYDQANATEAAGNAAEEAKKQIMGFDEINKLDDSTSNSSGSSNSSGDIAPIFGETEELTDGMSGVLKIITAIGGALAAWKIADSVIKTIESIKSLSALGNLALGITLTVAGFALEFDGIKSAIEEGVSGVNFAEIIIGGLTGTAGMGLLGKGIGQLIATVFSGSTVANAITAGGGTISTGLIGAAIGGIVAGIPMFVTGVYDAIVNGLNLLNGLLIPAGSTLAGAGIGAIIGSLGGPIGTGIGALIGLAVGALTDGIILIVQNWDEIKEFFAPAAEWFDENVIQPIGDFFSGLWTNISTWAGEAWDSIKEFFSPAVDWFSELFGSISQTVEDVFYNIGVIATGCWEIIQIVWGIFSTWFDTAVIQPVATFFSGLWASVSAWAIEAWGNIRSVFSKIANWVNVNIIRPVVSLLSVLWTSIKVVFGGVADFFRGILNGVISALNSALSWIFSGINSILSDLASFSIAGYSPFSGIRAISVPQIPYLAQGAVLPANKPFLAVVGDQKNGTNVEAPLETIKQAVAEVMGDMLPAMVAGFEALLEENQRLRATVEGIEVGDSTIGQAANRYNQRMAIIRG